MRKAFSSKIILLICFCSTIVFNACGPNCPGDPDCDDIVTTFTFQDEKILEKLFIKQ